jgi:ABC-type branched-subunit amino acid transport system ATPase component
VLLASDVNNSGIIAGGALSAMDNGAPGDRPTPTRVVEGVSFGYGQLKIVDGASLQVGQGEIVVLVGPNGAGKSTLVKGIIGQLPLLEGTLHLNGTDLSRTSSQARIRHGVGYVPQLRDVFPTLSVLENLEMGGYILSHESVKGRIDEVLEIFPALATMRHRKASALSGGERKMLAIGRALMAEPSVLILDEPTSNLAPNIAARVINEIVTDLASSGQAVLMIEQRVDMALAVATWGYVLVQGRMRLAGAASTLREASDLGSLFFSGGMTIPTADS